jgi:5-methylcytosine-specific restriction endonuclease McrA
MRKSRKRIHGNDRAYMMLARDVRRRWLQYGENRKAAKGLCAKCKKREGTQVDHIEPLGTRPYRPEDFCSYIHRMFNADCQALCKKCHSKKTKRERKG